MHIHVHANHMALTEALETHAKQVVEGTLGHLSDRIGRVLVNMEDVNGPKGGTDKRCKVEVGLNGMGSVFAEETDADMYQAITLATEKAGRSVTKHFDKKKEH